MRRRRNVASLGLHVLFCAVAAAAAAQYFDCVGDDDDDFECAESPRETVLCPATTSRDWVVSSTIQATALATAINCSGGVFNVEWRGMVTLDQELNVLDGTVLNVTGVESEAGVEGSGATRAFTVLNATLHLSNMLINNGSAAAGGAIVASGSSLVFDQTSFINNTAVHGGALYIDSESVISLSGKTSFSDNTAEEGGALHVSGRSNVSWSSETYFENNRADNWGDGGALFVSDGSAVSWSGETYFSRNSADLGGTLFLIDGSSAFWTAETSFFSLTGGNDAVLHVENASSVYWTASTSFEGDRDAWDGGLDGNGGALYVCDDSTARWSAETNFSNNFATYGGAVSVEYNSMASWNATTIFSRNIGATGGALRVDEFSSVFWTAETHFANNEALSGGAVYVDGESSVSWSAETYFSDNRAASEGESDGDGGALVVEFDSTVSWAAETLFSNNYAGYGGALSVGFNGAVTWDAKTTFLNNTASSTGGVLDVFLGSTVSWTAETYFSNNTADSRGGLAVRSGSTVSWAAETVFFNNSADQGGALFVEDVSSVSWTAETTFSDNRAVSGGALYVDSGAHVSWDAETSFSDNSAGGSGGAVFMGYNATLGWSGPTAFVSNRAVLDGGAVGSSLTDSEESSSTLEINGTTEFVGNTCEGNGGGVALVGALLFTVESEDVVFEGNSADIAGGAVFISATSVGPRFFRVSFNSNIAQVGGAVYATGSGTAVTQESQYSDIVLHPTTFIGCDFTANEAAATGGAMESGAGLDEFTNTTFVRNAAGAGGALRIAGTTSLDNCSFDSNVSGEGEGSAISSIGFIKQFRNCSFLNNTFDCATETFLDSTEAGDLFSHVCSGCDTLCDGCSPEWPAPVPVCLPELEHSSSAGGNATVESLEIAPGYWRATATSRDVLACYNTDACLGGITGTSGYCDEGYEGPYCSICSDGYPAAFGFTCNECTGKGSGFAVAAVVAVLVALLLVAFFSHLVSGDPEGLGRGVIARVTRRIPVQSLKIVIIVWQILTQFASIANVTYPDVYQQFLDGVDVLNFDLRWMTSVGCIVDMDFHGHLLITTIGPLVAFAFLGATYALAMGRNRGSAVAVENVQRKHLSAVLLVTFLVYSPVSSALFQMFACEELADDRDYLRADYRIECDDRRHRALQVYAGFMILVYTVGIPLLYGVLLFRNGEVLTDGERRKTDLSVTTTSDLWASYKPNRFYYEVIECGRRVLLAGVVVFIYPNTAAQVAVTLMIAVFFLLVSEGLAPYVSRWDAWVSRMGHVIVFTSMYVALLLKVDLSNEQANGQKVFEAILVSAHAIMFLAVVVEAIVMALALRKQQHESLRPRFRGGGVLSFLQETVPSHNVNDATGANGQGSRRVTRSAEGTSPREPVSR